MIWINCKQNFRSELLRVLEMVQMIVIICKTICHTRQTEAGPFRMIRFFCKKQMLYQTVLFRRGRPIKIIKVKILSWTSLQETFSSTFDVDVDDDDLVSQVLQKRTAGGWGCYELRHVLRDCLWIFCILCAVVLLQDLSFQMINGVSLWKCIILNFSTDVEVRITLHDDIKRAT